MWTFKPKGLHIHKTRRIGFRAVDGGPAYKLTATFNTKGRTGARARALFAQYSEYRRERALQKWYKGSMFEL